MARLRKVPAALADLLLPRTCIVCGRQLLTFERHICLYCLADFPYTHYEERTHNPMSDRFNAVIQRGLEERWSITEEREPYAYSSALFFYNHDAGYRQIPYQLKYHGNASLGRHFGQMLGKRLAHSPHFQDIDIIIPVPLHWTKKWSRGYNQAEIIASGAASVLHIPVRTDILRRCRRTQTQTRLSVEDKARNVSGAFHAAIRRTAEQPAGKDVRHILLVDDVFTTGATSYACFEALRKVFPAPVRISVATLGFVGE